MSNINDFFLATETIEDHMERLRGVFQCLPEAGFKMPVSKCDFVKSEFKYLGRIVSVEGIKLDPKAVCKLRDWDIPRNKTELQSFLGFANHYRDLIPWHAKLVAPLHAITGTGTTVLWGWSNNKLSTESRCITVHRQAVLLLFRGSGTRKLRKVVESRTKFTFDVNRVLDSTTVLVLDSTTILPAAILMLLPLLSDWSPFLSDHYLKGRRT